MKSDKHTFRKCHPTPFFSVSQFTTDMKSRFVHFTAIFKAYKHYNIREIEKTTEL